MRARVYIVGAIIWMVLIFFLSSLPGSKLGSDALALNIVKKIGHFTLFGVLAFFYLCALKGKTPLSDTGAVIYLLSFFLTVFYAVSDEYHQLFVPGRHAAATDVLIDSFGALSILGLIYLKRNRACRCAGTDLWKNC